MFGAAVTISVLAVLGRGLVDPATTVARADDLGLTRGDGCFEGARLRVDADGHGEVDKLDAHLARMGRSAGALEIEFDPAQWRDLLAEAATAWTTPGEAQMRLVLTRGPAGDGPRTGYVTIGPLPSEYVLQRRDGLRVITLARGTGSTAYRDAPWLLGGIKNLSYAVNMAAQREARRRGADDALFVSADGVVLEATTGSVVWAAGRVLHTTPFEGTGILAGTTQQMLFARAAGTGWDIAHTAATLDQLHDADVIWLIGSVRGPVDIVDLDGAPRRRQPLVDAEIRRLCGF